MAHCMYSHAASRAAAQDELSAHQGICPCRQGESGMPASRTQPAAARWSRWPPVKPASTVTPPGVHPPVITARHARFPCCAAGHDPDGGCRPRCRRDALIHMRIRGTTQRGSVGSVGQPARLLLGHRVSQAAGHLLVLRLFLPAAAEVAHERPAVTSKLDGGHLRQGQLSFQRRHQPWFRSASSPARAGGLVYTGIPARRAEGRRRAGKHPAVMPLALAALLATGTSGKLGVDGLHVRHDRHVRGGAGGDQAEAGA